MMVLWYILISTVIVSLISLIGILTLFSKKNVEHTLFLFIAFAAGAMIGAAFFDLLPEATEHLEDVQVNNAFFANPYVYVILGILAFFILERFVFWHHHHIHVGEHAMHDMQKHHAPFTYLNLVGDAIHNFIDGVIIAASYLISIPLGVVTTVAVIFHEIPQEIGDFSILVYGGFKPKKALFYNLLSGLVAVLGSLLAYLYATTVEKIIPFLLAFAAGGFIYIANSDLIPELQKERHVGRAIIQLCAFILGLGIIYYLTTQFHH